MATLPPTYSAREAARAQRAYQRSLRRPSMVGPLTLIFVGVLALLVETGRLDAFHLWDWYIRWWPLLLIAVGLLSLGEWFLERSAGGVGGYRRSHGGLITLILFFVVLGYLFSHSGRGLRGLHLLGHGVDQEDFFVHLMGREHEADRNLNQSLPSSATIDIQVPHGDVAVTLSGDDQIHVQAHQTVYASNERDAERSLNALAPQLTVNNRSVTLRAGDSNDGRADLTIELPHGTVPTVTVAQGDVTIEGLPGDATATAQHGDVKIDNLGGSAHVHISKGEFSAHEIKGDLSLDGRLDDVSISQVAGRTALDGDFFGDTNLAHMAGPVHFHSSRTDVEVSSLPGDLSIDSGDLQLNTAEGPVRVSTSAKDVECSGIAGDLRVEDGDGDIAVSAVAPLGGVEIHNRNGEIHLTVPVGSGFVLQATANNGDLDSKLALPVASLGEGHSQSGQVGSGGPSVHVLSDHGDIEITRGDSGLAPPAPPLPPPPPTPFESKPFRHLHRSPGANEEPAAPPVVQQ